MNLTYQTNSEGIDWQKVPEILRAVGMNFHTPEIHQQAFTASASVVFVFDSETLIGIGRAISDGVLQAALYDIAVLPPYQAKGIGKKIVQLIVDSLPGCTYILYASPGKEPFYRKLNFRLMKTGMALFRNPEHMQQRGFTD